MTDDALEAKLRELDELQPTLSRAEFIAKAEKELKPLWEQELKAHGAHEPDWEPLEKVLPYAWCGGFMFMGYEGEIRIYKQGFTRACLHLDPQGNAYRRRGSLFHPIDIDDAIADAFRGIESTGFARETPYNKVNAAQRRAAIEAETGYKILTIGHPPST